MSRTALWTWSDLGTALTDCLDPDTPLPASGPDVSGIAIDSRRVRAGDLFIAMPAGVGGRAAARDGHAWIPAAAQQGAFAALAMRPVVAEVPQIRVRDTYRALQALARHRRNAHRGQRIAVTGSAGKTTFKNLLAHVLDAHAAEGSFNNDLGVPLTLARMPVNAAHGVFEIGMNAPGEIAPLAREVAPRIAVVLNVLRAHRGAFDSDAALRREKLSIAAGLDAAGTLVVLDTLALDELPEAFAGRILRFGKSRHADVRLLDRTAHALTVQIGAQRVQVPWRLPGDHRLDTALASIATLHAAEALGTGILERLEHFELPPGRGAEERHGERTLIDDAYNANPDSMGAALQTLAARPGVRVALLGEMLELGRQSAEWHRELAPLCRRLDVVHLVGQGMQTLAAALADEAVEVHWWPEAAAIDCRALVASLPAAAVVLVKGSNAVFWQGDFLARLRAALAAAEAD